MTRDNVQGVFVITCTIRGFPTDGLGLEWVDEAGDADEGINPGRPGPFEQVITSTARVAMATCMPMSRYTCIGQTTGPNPMQPLVNQSSYLLDEPECVRKFDRVELILCSFFRGSMGEEGRDERGKWVDRAQRIYVVLSYVSWYCPGIFNFLGV